MNGATSRDGKHRDYIFHYDPADISKLYFYDLTQKRYIEIPYRDIRRPPITEWEKNAAIKRARERGRDQIDEDALFRAHEENKQLIDEAARLTKRQRRRNEAKRRRIHSVAVSPKDHAAVIDVSDLENARPFEDLEL